MLIILGDAGLNFWLDHRDYERKDYVSDIPVTLFCIHGNHEARPWETGTYREMDWLGGTVYVEDKYPYILFAKDGEIYDFNGESVLVLGGASSIDKGYRVARGIPWFASEVPDMQIMEHVDHKLDEIDWVVDVVLTHTVPIGSEPIWAFIPGVDQSKVDKTTEEWLQRIRNRLRFSKWYAGHYHVDCVEDGIHIMYKAFDEICMGICT